MPKLYWERTTFTGIHTEQAKVENGEAYARDMANLRVDGDGWLQPRSKVSDFGKPKANMTGVAATPNHLFALQENRRVIWTADLENFYNLAFVDKNPADYDLEGRISVADFGTYYLMTSEGSDNGYLIDARDPDALYAYPLGLDPPPSPRAFGIRSDQFDRRVPNLVSSNLNASLTADTYYYYAVTYVSLEDSDDPYYEMESNPNLLPEVFEHPLIFTGQDAQGRQAVATQVHIPYNRTAPITHIRLYRTAPLTGNDFELEGTEISGFTIDPPAMRKIADIDIRELPQQGVLIFYDGLPDETWQEQAELRRDNDRLPSHVKQIYRYQDLVFAPAGDKLLYSDLRFGNPVVWAYPPVNDHVTGARIDWCAEINEVLLFGSREGTWRLTGGTEYNFAIGQISGQGAIDGYAWGKIKDGLAFVGEAGLFATDGSVVLDLSEETLDGFFEDKKATRGAVAFFKDGNILFNVTLKNDGETADYQFKREDGYWTRWNIDFWQAATRIKDNEATLVIVADGTPQLKSIDWNATEHNIDNKWLFQSHVIDFEKHNKANDKKRFTKLEFTGHAEGQLRLDVYKDDDTEPTQTTNFRTRNASLNPVRVPINRIGRRLAFKLSGIGNCKITGLRLEAIA